MYTVYFVESILTPETPTPVMALSVTLTWKLYEAFGSKSETVNECLSPGSTCRYSLTDDD